MSRNRDKQVANTRKDAKEKTAQNDGTPSNCSSSTSRLLIGERHFWTFQLRPVELWLAGTWVHFHWNPHVSFESRSPWMREREAVGDSISFTISSGCFLNPKTTILIYPGIWGSHLIPHPLSSPAKTLSKQINCSSQFRRNTDTVLKSSPILWYTTAYSASLFSLIVFHSH